MVYWPEIFHHAAFFGIAFFGGALIGFFLISGSGYLFFYIPLEQSFTPIPFVVLVSTFLVGSVKKLLKRD